MVKSGHSRARTPTPITPLPFQPPKDERLQIEVQAFGDLRRRVSLDLLGGVNRPDFHQLIGVTAGHCIHTVDFEDSPANPGDWILVKAAQVHRIDVVRTWEGWVVAFQPETVTDAAAFDALKLGHPLDKGQDAQMRAAMRQLLEDMRQGSSAALRNAVLGLQLNTVLARLHRWQSERTGEGVKPGPQVARYQRFRVALEQNFRRWHFVQNYTCALGVTEKTLNRVCLQHSGSTAKACIAGRIALEARRLLVHTQSPVQVISASLGFGEPTNFVKFFKRETGTTPQAFRRWQFAL